MSPPDLVKRLSRRTRAPTRHVLRALSDALFGISLCSYVKQALIGFGVLHDGCRLPFDCEHNRALAPLQLFHKIAGTSAEGRQRLDVTGNVQRQFAHE